MPFTDSVQSSTVCCETHYATGLRYLSLGQHELALVAAKRSLDTAQGFLQVARGWQLLAESALGMQDYNLAYCLYAKGFAACTKIPAGMFLGTVVYCFWWSVNRARS
jgi:hypothetical protein